MTTAENDNDAVAALDVADLFADPPPERKLTLLGISLGEDPFATTRLEDGENPIGGASCLARYERASAAYIAACHGFEQDDDEQEILRLIAAYWLRKSRAFWLA
ncbi:hypothetical protein [Mesorhizobium sp. B2-4-6]|uniref:hypothetical protein n=1 Tax=Mesorhizobium sp. B2-4-6 TaxID=2589943 RepID=UPI00112821E5|nr:hypothetical protein [Mesorhizobium sp. B2-4-6]TPL45329.1 hypothetical protein FJ957_20685 [Mesorhizobium sp. B2-4-6]